MWKSRCLRRLVPRQGFNSSRRSSRLASLKLKLEALYAKGLQRGRDPLRPLKRTHAWRSGQAEQLQPAAIRSGTIQRVLYGNGTTVETSLSTYIA